MVSRGTNFDGLSEPALNRGGKFQSTGGGGGGGAIQSSVTPLDCNDDFHQFDKLKPASIIT